MASHTIDKHWDQWIDESDADLIVLDHDTDERRMVILNGDDEFTLIYPKDYPSGKCKLETEAKSLKHIVEAVNAESAAAATPLSLGQLLSLFLATAKKRKKLAASGAHAPGGSKASRSHVDEEEDEEDDEGEGDDNEDQMDVDEEYDGATGFDEGLEIRDEELDLLKKKKRWRIKEEALREEAKREQEEKRRQLRATLGINATSKQEVENIFTGNAATGVLTNDLINIMQNAKKLGFTAKPVDDNIYDWEVRLFGFTSSCGVYKDLIKVQEKFGYDHVALRISFKMDLYPFYPPLVKLVRPRFKGFMMGRITSMEMLKLANWDPVKDMTFYIQAIRSMLEKYGQIDVENFMNDSDRYPQGAYTEFEYLLLELELLSDKDPRANLKYPQPDWMKQEKAAAVAKREEQDKNRSKEYWARGTGYGHDQASSVSWNVQAYLAAQRERDMEIERVISSIAKEVRKSAQMPPQYLSSAFLVLEESCLVPWLEQYLSNDSFLDMNRHLSLYNAIFDVVRAIADHKFFRPLLAKLEHQRTSLMELISRLNQQASIYLKTVASAAGAKNEEDAIAHNIQQTFDACSTAIKSVSGAGEGAGLAQGATPTSPSTSGQLVQSLDTKYEQLMRPLQFDYEKIYGSTKYSYFYTQNASSEGAKASKERVLRLAQEHSNLSQSLPLNKESTVFVRVDNDRMDVMTCLITGPLDTPYAGGCFVFDIFFPANYPGGPPLVNLATTGQGSVRFNPNLYNTGKVCLSLLGTWQGAEGETWNKDTSTLLQVLVSIQSLILVPQPYFNEPGFERSMGTPEGDASSRAYNENIQHESIRWAILDQLRNPKVGYEEVIQNHFYVLQEPILKVIQSWIDDPKASAMHKAKLEKQITEVRMLFSKLQTPVVRKRSEDEEDD